MHSDIHVAVRFHDQSVFAGEQLRCTITFRNVANLSEEPVATSLHARSRSRRESISQLAAQATRRNSTLRLGQNGRHLRENQPADHPGHRRPSPSLNNQDPANNNNFQRPVHRQQRSISIISVASPIITGDVGTLPSGAWDKQKRPGHSRSSTVQIQPGKLDTALRRGLELIFGSTTTQAQPAGPKRPSK